MKGQRAQTNEKAARRKRAELDTRHAEMYKVLPGTPGISQRTSNQKSVI